MDLMEAIERSSQAECREIGELILSLADSPRDASWQANIAIARAKFTSPKELSLIEALEAGSKRLTDALAAVEADGMGHRTLIEAELERRGDPRTFEEWRADMGHVRSDAV